LSAAAPAASTVPVFVELFTSEGCSSCPLADALLSKLISPGAIPGVEIVPVSWHVDYWDGLGWKDPLSTREATDRQRAYATILKQSSVYTPEMIVAGRTGFVGSDRAAALEAIKAAARAPIARIALKLAGDPAAGKGSLEAAIPALPALAPGQSAGVMLAVAEDGIVHDIGAGENDGRKLHHDAAVRAFSRIGSVAGPAASALAAEWRLPAGVVAGRTHLVVWAQAPDGRILAAGRLAL
jgi:hypothetical protein